MKTIRARLGIPDNDNAGFTLIEVVVAMMVFAIIAVGVAFSLTSSLTMTRDARSREVAANLAAQEIDLDRATGSIFALVDTPTPTPPTVVDGVTYHVQRLTHWLTGGDDTATCGTGSGTLQYKRVNVSVTWDGMRSTTAPVQADTVIAPKSRVNDPARGTILVSVLSASGTGVAGVTVTAAPGLPADGAAAITTAPSPTDAQGCSYILKVAPGNYHVTISRAAYADVNENVGSATTSVGVSAGSSVAANFQFDLAGNFTTTYPAALLPTDLDTSYVSTYGVFVATAPTPNPAQLHPFSAGYQVLAGKYVTPSDLNAGCLSVDPNAWTTAAPDRAVGRRDPPFAAVPGGSATARVRLGTLGVTGISGQYVTAVSQVTAPGTGDPGCAVPMTYQFALLTASPATIALPFGSWALYTGNTPGSQTTRLGAASLALASRGQINPASGIVTLDPRQVTP